MLKGNIFSEIRNIGAGYGTVFEENNTDIIDTVPFNSVTLTWILRSLTGDEGVASFSLQHGDGDSWPADFSDVSRDDILGPIDEYGRRPNIVDGVYKIVDVAECAENLTVSVCYTGAKRYIRGTMTVADRFGSYFFCALVTFGAISSGRVTARYGVTDPVP